jgi:hypothetical protein
MRQRIVYAKLEKIMYEFDDDDVKKALLKLLALPDYKEGRTVDFEWDSDDMGKLSVTLLIKYTTEEREE